MTSDEIAGRLHAMEVMTVMALGLYLANARNDPDGELTRGLIAELRETIATVGDLKPSARRHAIEHSNGLLTALQKNLSAFRGHGLN